MVFVDALRLGFVAFGLCGIFSATANAADLTYATDVKPLLDRSCVECHHEGARRPNLTRFPFTTSVAEDQAAIVRRILLKVKVDAPTMPPGPRPKLTANEVQLIGLWLEQGLKP